MWHVFLLRYGVIISTAHKSAHYRRWLL